VDPGMKRGPEENLKTVKPFPHFTYKMSHGNLSGANILHFKTCHVIMSQPVQGKYNIQ
jgi:hypothetical protein